MGTRRGQKKTKTLVKTEIMKEKEDESIDLSATARLDFTLTKNDIIEYYLADTEEKIEQDIKDTLAKTSRLLKEADELKTQFGDEVKRILMKEHAATVKAATKALKKVHELGFSDGYYGNYEVTVKLHDRCVTMTERHADHEPFIVHDYRRILGKKVPPDIWSATENSYNWFEGNHKYFVEPYKQNGKSVSRGTLEIGSARSGTLNVDWNEKLTSLAHGHCSKLNERVLAVRELHALLLRHDSLPQLKRQIKKQVVGRVLKNTAEGKLMLKALSGLKGLDPTKTLTG